MNHDAWQPQVFPPLHSKDHIEKPSAEEYFQKRQVHATSALHYLESQDGLKINQLSLTRDKFTQPIGQDPTTHWENSYNLSGKLTLSTATPGY